MRFTKMQAFGNDYVYIDAIHQKLKNLPELARFVSDRHFAIGSDGMVPVSYTHLMKLGIVALPVAYLIGWLAMLAAETPLLFRRKE